MYKLNSITFSFCYPNTGLCFAIGFENRSFALTFGTFDLRLANTFGLKNCRFLFALRIENGGTSIALGAHLFFHRLLNVVRWGDIFEFNAVDLHAPLVGGIVHDLAKFAINLVA